MMNLDHILEWWKANGGLFSDLAGVQEYAVVHRPPDAADRFPAPILMGPASLQAQTLGCNSPDVLIGEMAKRVPQYAEEGLREYGAALRSWEPTMDVRHVKGQLSCGLVDITYARLLLPVRTSVGARMVMTFSQSVSVH